MAQELYNPGMNFAESSKYYNGMPRLNSYTGSNYVRQIMADKINQQNTEEEQKRQKILQAQNDLENIYGRVQQMISQGAKPNEYLSDLIAARSIYQDLYGQGVELPSNFSQLNPNRQ